MKQILTSAVELLDPVVGCLWSVLKVLTVIVLFGVLLIACGMIAAGVAIPFCM